MPLRNFSVPFTELDGEPFTRQVERKDSSGNKIKEDENLTIAYLVHQCLNNTIDGERLEPDERSAIYSLMVRVHEGVEREYTQKEIDLIEKRAARLLTSNVAYGRLMEVLKPESVARPSDPPTE